MRAASLQDMTHPTDHDVARFQRDGFLPGPRVLDADRLETVRRAVDAVAAEESPGMSRVLAYRRRRDLAASQVHVLGAWRAEQALADLVSDATVVEWTRRLMRTRQVRLFRDQLFVKPAASDGIVPWHQDYSDWVHTTPPAHVTCWIALDDATIESGCLHYIPGSHMGTLLPKITAADDFRSAAMRLPAGMPAPVPVEVLAGHCVFHHCLTIHGSYENRTPGTRRALAVAYMHPETTSVVKRDVIPGSAIFDEGQRIEGPLFPLFGGAP